MSDVKVRKPIWVKISAYGFAAVLFAGSAVGGLGWYRQSSMSDDQLRIKVQSDLNLIQTDMGTVQKAASALALSIAADPGNLALIEKGDRAALLEKYSSGMASVGEIGGLRLLTFLDANGTAIFRAHASDKFGDDVRPRRKTVAAALTSGKLTAGVEPGRTALSIYAVAPIIRDGKVIGAVDVGTELANPYFGPLSERTRGEIAVDVMVDGKLQTQASTNDGKPLLSPESLQAAYDGKPVAEPIAIGDRDLVVRAVPLNSFSGEKIGVLEIGADATHIVAANHQALWQTVVGTIVASLLALLGFFFFARSLANVIGRLTGTMSQLAAGDLSANVEGGNRPDEIGAMAQAVQVFKDSAIRARQLEQEADTTRSQVEEQRRRSAEIEQKRANEMAEATNSLAEGLKQLSAGNLSIQLAQPLAEEFESLRADFNSAVHQLRTALTEVAQTTGSIDSGSREVSQSADDLSKRTEQQAASLEQTAAALDEITANVSNSSKRAEEARAVAIQANESARHSGAVVANAVDAMGKIEQSSGQISNIIGVIDDIAFQTNLLALNAGVEAARAGEAGKGFAVVAQEVRELAQRSATAAKEIKGLIRNSSVEVENGVKLVSETGQALKTIEGYIVTINQHMDSIATSAREQSVGLSEVNTAVNQMDQVTQQNAAMVEEANAAGATLAQEAGRLRDLVRQFRVDGSAGSVAPSPRRSAPAAAVASQSAPVASPARSMVGKIAKAFSGRGSAAAAVATESWEEF
jgi:methyl-accepting chemotaxis protein